MLLLPFIMEYDGPPNAKPIQERKKSTRKLEFFDYIYLMENNELLKFKMELDHMDVVNILEKYIDSQKTSDSIILSEQEAKKTNIPLKFLYYLGNYKLEDKLLKTKNYLVPKQSAVLNLMIEKYKDGIVDSTDLYNFSCVMGEAIDYEDDNTKEIVYDLFKSVNVELVEKFEIDTEELTKTIDNISTLLKNSSESRFVLNHLKFILQDSKSNKKYIETLSLKQNFDEAISKEKVK